MVGEGDFADELPVPDAPAADDELPEDGPQ